MSEPQPEPSDSTGLPTGAKIWLSELKPRLDAGKDAAQIAAELGMDESYVRGMIDEWQTPLCIRDGPQLFAHVVDVLKRHFYMEKEWHYIVTALWVFQAKIAVLLPATFYLFIGGRFGSGKTNLLNLLQMFSGGMLLENSSVAVLGRTMEYGRPVLFDEYDVPRNKDYDETRDALVRQGYKSTAAPYKRWNAARNAAEEFPIYGPKALTLRGLLDPALQSRGYEIPTVKCEGEDGFSYVLLNLWPELENLPALLDEWSRIAQAAFDADTLRAIAGSEGFREKVRAVVTELGANRESELAVIALLVAHVAGLDILAELRKANELRQAVSGEADADDLAQIAQVVLELATVTNAKILDEAPEVTIRQPDIKKRVNEGRKAAGQRAMTDSRFATLRQELGIKAEWLTNTHGTLVWHIPSSWPTWATWATSLHMEAGGPGGAGGPREAPPTQLDRHLAFRAAAEAQGRRFKPEGLPEDARTYFNAHRARFVDEGAIIDHGDGSFSFSDRGIA